MSVILNALSQMFSAAASMSSGSNVQNDKDEKIFGNESNETTDKAQAEKDEIKQQIRNVQKQLEQLKTKLSDTTSTDEQSDINSQMKDKQDELNCLQGSLGNDSSGQSQGTSGFNADNFVNMMVQIFQTILNAFMGALQQNGMGGNSFAAQGSSAGSSAAQSGSGYSPAQNSGGWGTSPVQSGSGTSSVKNSDGVSNTGEVENVSAANSNVDPNSYNINRDTFAKELNASFASHKGSVLQGKGAEIYDIAVQNGVNPALFAAIICNETGYGTSKRIKNQNNPGGIKNRSGSFKTYGSLNEGLNGMAKLLKKSYIDQGRTSISSIGNKYCPGSSLWKKNVTQLYKKFSS